MTRSMTICAPWDADIVARSWMARYGAEPVGGRIRVSIAANIGGTDALLGKSIDGAFDALWPLVRALRGLAFAADAHIADAGIQQTWGESDSLTIVIGPAVVAVDRRGSQPDGTMGVVHGR